MNHIVLGTDASGSVGLMLGAVAVAFVALICVAANRLSWHHPRALQQLGERTVGALKLRTLDPLAPRAEYEKRDISPYFWPNGKLPASREWQELAADGFRDFRLCVSGLVQHPVELSLREIQEMGKQQQITLHQCIQGWSGIAEWGGLPMTALIEMVRPQPAAKVVVFHTFGEGLYGGEYYETHSMRNALHPQSLLAYEMNYQPLNAIYGAPLRLRVENQLGYKMAKWIKSIEFVASEKQMGDGFGGKNEDDEYFDLVPNI
jgi:DMSO/TMAO reductase YedYZ molybdopterin-dependent catalytic subunit